MGEGMYACAYAHILSLSLTRTHIFTCTLCLPSTHFTQKHTHLVHDLADGLRAGEEDQVPPLS